MLSLGVDLGNAKVKLCLGAAGQPPRLLSRPLPYDDRRAYERHDDIERGLTSALDELLGKGAARVEPSVVVLVTSAGYAYPSHRQGVMHAAELLLRLLPRSRSYLLGASLEAVRAEEARGGDPERVGPLSLSNPCGAALLARRLGALGPEGRGLALDTGGQTTGTLVVDGERMDPAALSAPERYVAHRAEHGKLVWVGVETTPLDSLAAEVSLGARRYEVIARGVPFANVAALLGLVEPERARKLALFGLLPSRARALRAVADAVNLDVELASDDEIEALARRFYEIAVERLASGLGRALATAPPGARSRAACFGLGARSLALPALRRAGLDAVALGDRLLDPLHAEAASCFGPWHLGLEIAAGAALPVLGAREPGAEADTA